MATAKKKVEVKKSASPVRPAETPIEKIVDDAIGAGEVEVVDSVEVGADTQSEDAKEEGKPTEAELNAQADKEASDELKAIEEAKATEEAEKLRLAKEGKEKEKSTTTPVDVINPKDNNVDDAIAEEKVAKVKLYKIKFLENHTFQVGIEKVTAKKDDKMEVELHIANLLAQRKIAFMVN